MKLKLLISRRASWIIWVGPMEAQGPLKVEERDSRDGKKADSGIMAGFEDGGRIHEPRNVGSLWKLEKDRKQILP